MLISDHHDLLAQPEQEQFLDSGLARLVNNHQVEGASHGSDVGSDLVCWHYPCWHCVLALGEVSTGLLPVFQVVLGVAFSDTLHGRLIRLEVLRVRFGQSADRVQPCFIGADLGDQVPHAVVQSCDLFGDLIGIELLMNFKPVPRSCPIPLLLERSELGTPSALDDCGTFRVYCSE